MVDTIVSMDGGRSQAIPRPDPRLVLAEECREVGGRVFATLHETILHKMIRARAARAVPFVKDVATMVSFARHHQNPRGARR